MAGELAEGLARVLRTESPVDLVVAGRTDAGVHARGQVAHVDVSGEAYAALPGRSRRTPSESLVQRLAGVLAPDLVVREVVHVPDGFDARFSAIGRRYRYRIADTPHPPDPLVRHHVVWVREALDVDSMNRAALPLTGEHDFVAYCRPRPGATTVRTLRRFDVERAEGGLAVLDLEADAFCHNQVRALAGALIAVGAGRRDETWPSEVLAARRRDGAVHVAPPQGLTLEEVRYPRLDEVAAQAQRARRVREQPR